MIEACLTSMLHAVRFNSFLMCLNWSSVFSCTFTYSGACNHNLNCFIIFGGLITSSLAKYPGLDYGCIILVSSRLVLSPMDSSLLDCLLYWLKLIANGPHEYHKEYYWPNISSFAHKGLLSPNLQHFYCWECVQLGILPLQLMHGLNDGLLNCFSFLSWFWSGCIMYN